IKNRFFKDSKK
ncbi:hypothetical protein ACTFIW_003408, partial [Dictyostelium discoideum]